MWAFMASWFSPSTVIFGVLNLVIGTIFITSNLRHPNKQQPEGEHHNQPQLVRAPSILERVRSFNFSLYRSENPDPLQPETHHQADPPHEDEEEAHHQSHDRHVTRSKSKMTAGEVPAAKPTARMIMKKSASEKFSVEEEEVDLRRPATMTERNRTAFFGEDEEVDAKADDFINRFKKQLKLQRLDSILRYREMLNRGSGK